MAALQATAIVVAAGRGERFRGEKVLLPLGGKPVLTHVLEAVERAQTVQAVIIVAGAHVRTAVDALVADGGQSKPCRVINGGPRRQDSVAAGLAAVPGDTRLVAILDGARPLTTGALIDRCVLAAEGGGAIAAIPVTDTLKRVDEDGMVAATVPRDGLWAVQTPQVFPAACLHEAFRRAGNEKMTYTDEASLFESLGWPVKIVKGDPANIKITWPGDIALAGAFLAATRETSHVDG